MHEIERALADLKIKDRCLNISICLWEIEAENSNNNYKRQYQIDRQIKNIQTAINKINDVIDMV